VQALAALAVHDPAADFDAAVAAMSAAAGHVRHGAVEVSPDGDLLGMVDGAVVLTGATPAEAAGRVASRLLAAGGELLTLVVGADAPEDLVAELERHVGAAFPAVEVQVLPGGQPDVLALGVE
jgi:dihydroxyacetone kinase-like predicted kinase